MTSCARFGHIADEGVCVICRLRVADATPEHRAAVLAAVDFLGARAEGWQRPVFIDAVALGWSTDLEFVSPSDSTAVAIPAVESDGTWPGPSPVRGLHAREIDARQHFNHECPPELAATGFPVPVAAGSGGTLQGEVQTSPPAAGPPGGLRSPNTPAVGSFLDDGPAGATLDPVGGTRVALEGAAPC